MRISDWSSDVCSSDLDSGSQGSRAGTCGFRARLAPGLTSVGSCMRLARAADAPTTLFLEDAFGGAAVAALGGDGGAGAGDEIGSASRRERECTDGQT